MLPYKKPTKAEMAAAANQTVPDIIAPNLKVLFCGINPSLYTAVVGHRFARPGNRFWPVLHRAGFTPYLFAPHQDVELLQLGYGITDVVARATVSADQLAREEFVEGGKRLVEKVKNYKPQVLAVLGITAYRKAFDCAGAGIGLQEQTLGSTRIWVLPNPSGLNAHFPPEALAEVYRELRLFSDAQSTKS
ncbi:G/U mismatch-specific DNA glycosylase [Pontibacter sp. 172403-2]|uniref:G/U mismatch-specific DNA glycosylase n=1 Tax=Pontibacter rufus TaxID=2791028 RepID=UPI0018AF9F31|nr:G/U mismatch-specific DNA glycosylase [Pontibacter sp. 172403-2]MBF9254462.1 G/U mismatch-specific DNA glycosylase [Pontibacter sp. 172403-2]